MSGGAKDVVGSMGMKRGAALFCLTVPLSVLAVLIHRLFGFLLYVQICCENRCASGQHIMKGLHIQLMSINASRITRQ
jgi:hypothetical protein